MGRLDGKRILVTGAATGIGRATAIRVASDGARVAAFDIEDGSASATLAAIEAAGGDARYWHVDVTDEPGVSAAVDEAAEWMGGGHRRAVALGGDPEGRRPGHHQGGRRDLGPRHRREREGVVPE